MDNPVNKPRMAPLLERDFSAPSTGSKPRGTLGRGRYLVYGALLLVVAGLAAWRFLWSGQPALPDATVQNADRVREQASAPPPPAPPDNPAENSGPQPKVAGRRPGVK